jgi:hypothetical protein
MRSLTMHSYRVRITSLEMDQKTTESAITMYTEKKRRERKIWSAEEDHKEDLLTTGSFWYERSDTADIASSLRAAVGPERSETTSSSSGSSNGDRSMRCVCDVVCGATDVRTLLCRDVLVRLGGAALRGR